MNEVLIDKGGSEEWYEEVFDEVVCFFSVIGGVMCSVQWEVLGFCSVVRDMRSGDEGCFGVQKWLLLLVRNLQWCLV